MATLTQRRSTAESLFGQIIDSAVTRSSSEGRNNAAFSMGLQLRDNGFSQPKAESAAEEYAEIVGDGTFLRREAVDAIQSAYSRPAREPWSRLNSHLSLFSRSIQTNRITKTDRAQEQVHHDRIDRDSRCGLYAPNAKACSQRWSASGASATIRSPEAANTGFNDWRAA